MRKYDIFAIDLTKKEKEKLHNVLDDEKVKFITSDRDNRCTEEKETPYLVIIPWRTWKMYSEGVDNKIIHIKHTENKKLKDINLVSECVLGISSELIDNKKEMKALLESAQGLKKFITTITKEKELYRELYLKKAENLEFLEDLFQTIRSNEMDIDNMLKSILHILYEKFKVNDICIAIKNDYNWTVYSSDRDLSSYLSKKYKIGDHNTFFNIDKIDRDNCSSFVYEVSLDAGNCIVLLSLEDENLVMDDYKIIDIAANYICYALLWMMKVKKISDFAYKDPLTGVGNRHHFDMILRHEIERHKRINSPFSLIILDIDDFKHINDTYGHQVGDIILKQLALKLKYGTREIDHIIRYGGEEFLILLPHTEKKEALIVADRLRRIVENSIFTADKQSLKITISLGVSQFHPLHENDITLAIKKADDALYRAKKEGKNRTCLASE